MYNLPYFKEKNFEVLYDFMKQHPFVVLCGVSERKEPVATQVPVLLETRGDQLFLVGHMMKQTDHHKAYLVSDQALVLFTGAHTYVSASWYTDPLQGSTWNYMTVHARGKLSFLPHDQLFSILERITALFENNSDSPSLVHKLPKEYVTRLSQAIVAFEIAVTSVENVFKLSQNRDEGSYSTIINQLMQGNDGARAIALEMKKREAGLFASNHTENDSM